MIYNFASLIAPTLYNSPLHSTVRVPTVLIGLYEGARYAEWEAVELGDPRDRRVRCTSALLSALTTPYTVEVGSTVIAAAMACTRQFVSWSVAWLTCSATTAALTSTVAAYTVGAIPSFILIFIIHLVHVKLNCDTAKWLVNDASSKEYWQNLFLRARSYVGFANAGHFNAVNDQQLKYININMLKRLPISELMNIDSRIINALPRNDKIEINSLLLTSTAKAHVERINASAENEEDISIDELNSLSACQIQVLRSPVLLQIEDQQGGPQRLSHRVLNNLSPLTLAELPVSILLNLSQTTLQNLQPHVLNGSSFDLEQYLPAHIKQHLSVIPIRWDGRAILDIATPNIAKHVRKHRRLYWIENDGNYRAAAPVEGQ